GVASGKRALAWLRQRVLGLEDCSGQTRRAPREGWPENRSRDEILRVTPRAPRRCQWGGGLDVLVSALGFGPTDNLWPGPTRCWPWCARINATANDFECAVAEMVQPGRLGRARVATEQMRPKLPSRAAHEAPSAPRLGRGARTGHRRLRHLCAGITRISE